MKKIIFLSLILFSSFTLFTFGNSSQDLVAVKSSKSVDFRISKIVLNKNYQIPTVGDTEVGFDFTIENIRLGSATLSSNKYITLKCSDVNGTNLLTEKLDYGTFTKNKSVVYKEVLISEDDLLPIAQTFKIKCSIKTSGIKESNTHNNTKNFSFKVVKNSNINYNNLEEIVIAKKPDLIIENVGPDLSQPQPTVGDTSTSSSWFVKIKNIGNADFEYHGTSMQGFALYCKDIKGNLFFGLEYDDFSLVAGQSYYREGINPIFTQTLFQTAGTKILYCKVDYNNKVQESNESNNSFQVSFPVSE